MIVAHTCGPNTFLWDFIYSFHMPLFFIVSGFFFKKESILLIIGKSFNRLLIPYFTTCIIIVCLSQMRQRHNLLIDINDIFYGLGPGWFLLALFLSRIIFYCILKMFPNCYLLVSLVVSLCISYVVPIYNLSSYFAFYPSLVSLFYVSLGYYTRQIDILNNANFRFLTFGGLIMWIVTILYGEVIIALCILKLSIIDLCGSIGGTLIVYRICQFINKYTCILKRVLIYAGRYSLVILFFHSIDYCIYIWYIIEPYISNEIVLLSFITISRLILMFICVYVSTKVRFLRIFFNIT